MGALLRQGPDIQDSHWGTTPLLPADLSIWPWIVFFCLQTAILLLRIDDIVSGVKKQSDVNSAGGAAAPREDQPPQGPEQWLPPLVGGFLFFFFCYFVMCAACFSFLLSVILPVPFIEIKCDQTPHVNLFCSETFGRILILDLLVVIFRKIFGRFLLSGWRAAFTVSSHNVC